MELLCGLQAWHHPVGADDMEVGEDAGHMAAGTQFFKADTVFKPPPLEPEMTSLGSHRQPGPGLRNHQIPSVDSWAPCKSASATTFSTKPAPSGPGRPESPEYLETVCTSSLQQNHSVHTAPSPTQQPTVPPSPEQWVPTRTTSCVPHGKAGLAGPYRPEEQEESVGIPRPPSAPRTVVLQTCGLSSPQTQSCIPHVRHPLLGLSANSCIPLGQQQPQRTAAHRGREEREPCSQQPDPPLEGSGDGKACMVPAQAQVRFMTLEAFCLHLPASSWPDEIDTHHPSSPWEPVRGVTSVGQLWNLGWTGLWGRNWRCP